MGGELVRILDKRYSIININIFYYMYFNMGFSGALACKQSTIERKTVLKTTNGDTLSKTPEKAKQIAEPVRKALTLMLRQKLKKSAERVRVAKTTGMSTATLDALIYSERGSFDVLVAAVLATYRLDHRKFSQFFEVLKVFLAKNYRVTKGEREFYAAAELLSEQELHDWGKSISVLAKINHVMKERPISKKRNSSTAKSN